MRAESPPEMALQNAVRFCHHCRASKRAKITVEQKSKLLLHQYLVHELLLSVFWEWREDHSNEWCSYKNAPLKKINKKQAAPAIAVQHSGVNKALVISVFFTLVS